jgi:hypothetical protein
MHGPKGTVNQEKNSAGPVKPLRKPTGTVVRGEAIRQKIIGHVLLSAASGVGTCSAPRTEKRGYLLPEIGAVAEPRKFVALQGIARGSEKEFPRRRGARSGQDGLLSDRISIGVRSSGARESATHAEAEMSVEAEIAFD